MDGFNNMMRIAIPNRWLKGFKIGNREREELEICHLLYADDTMISRKQELPDQIRMILIYGGQYGRKEMEDALKIGPDPYIK